MRRGRRMPAVVKIGGGDDEEAVGEIELVAAAAGPAERCCSILATRKPPLHRAEHDEAGSDWQDGSVKGVAADEVHPVPAGPEGDPEDKRGAEDLEGEETPLMRRFATPLMRWCCMNGAPKFGFATKGAVGEDGAEAAEGDGVGAAEVGTVSPDGIAAGEDCSGVGADGDKEEQHGDEDGLAAPEFEEQKAEQGEEEIEHLFDGEGPEHVPVGGEVSAGVGFQPVDVEGERGEERLRQRGDFGRDAEAVDVGEVQDAEDREQEQ